jgi:hypothetical protein
MNKEFEILFDYAKKLRSRYLNTLSSFKIFERFNKLSAPNIIGKKKAEKNVKIFNIFKYFFITTKEASRCYFFIELAKFFDTSKKSLTINKVINYAEKNISKFTKQDFLDYHNGRQILPQLFSQYKQLSLSDLRKIKKRLDRNKAIIKKLKIYRDKYLAHDDINKIKIGISAKEIKVLLDIVKSVIELLYNKLDFSVNSYINFEKEPIKALDSVMENLIKFEENRLKEIREKYKI